MFDIEFIHVRYYIAIEFIHIRYYTHFFFNLIVYKSLKKLDDSIIKIRNAIRYVRSLFAKLVSFNNCMKKLKVQSKSLVYLDIVTRWTSI